MSHLMHVKWCMSNPNKCFSTIMVHWGDLYPPFLYIEGEFPKATVFYIIWTMPMILNDSYMLKSSLKQIFSFFTDNASVRMSSMGFWLKAVKTFCQKDANLRVTMQTWLRQQVQVPSGVCFKLLFFFFKLYKGQTEEFQMNLYYIAHYLFKILYTLFTRAEMMQKQIWTNKGNKNHK